MTAASAPRSFDAVLRDALAHRDMSHKQLADALGISENSVTNWTKGKYRPGHERAERLAAVFGMTMDELHGRAAPAPVAPAAAFQPQPPTPPPTDDEAQRIVRQLAALNVDAALDELQRRTPPLMEILAAARQHAAQRNGNP